VIYDPQGIAEAYNAYHATASPRAMSAASSPSNNMDLPITGGNRPSSSSSTGSASQNSSVPGGGGSYTNGSAAAMNNGAGAASYASPLPAGHQQDLNYLYEQIQELSKMLQANRVRTAELSRVAETMRQNGATTANGTHPVEATAASAQSDSKFPDLHARAGSRTSKYGTSN
jgi:hypothetical protein